MTEGQTEEKEREQRVAFEKAHFEYCAKRTTAEASGCPSAAAKLAATHHYFLRHSL